MMDQKLDSTEQRLSTLEAQAGIEAPPVALAETAPVAGGDLSGDLSELKKQVPPRRGWMASGGRS